MLLVRVLAVLVVACPVVVEWAVAAVSVPAGPSVVSVVLPGLVLPPPGRCRAWSWLGLSSLLFLSSFVETGRSLSSSSFFGTAQNLGLEVVAYLACPVLPLVRRPLLPCGLAPRLYLVRCQWRTPRRLLGRSLWRPPCRLRGRRCGVLPFSKIEEIIPEGWKVNIQV